MSDFSCRPTATECAMRLSAILRRAIGPLRHKRKMFARRINTDHRTLDNYLYGRHCPPIEKLVVLMAECPDLCDEVLKLVEEVRKGRSKRP
jgi:hypothetical protein